jgi:1-acyl-sn-glycerol-3-phosphate acyltransferase
MSTALLVLWGAAGGSFLAGLQGHPTRVLGLVPIAATGLAVTLGWATLRDSPSDFLCVLAGALGGLIHVPLVAGYQAGLPADARGNGMALVNAAALAGMALLGLLLAGLAGLPVVGPAGLPWVVTVLAAAGAALAWHGGLRDTYDLLLQTLFWPFYRVRGRGPGLEQVPRSGPLLVIANHTSLFDAIWLARLLPRRLTGLLTSVYYDRPVLHFMATRILHAIRVEAAPYRREAPELAEVIAALDRGEGVLIFPEGQVRRRADQPLRPFARGIWHVLKERPATPVLVCWVEGGWGSFASYAGGPPLKNKRLDWRRPIGVAMAAPQVLDAALLDDHRATRSHLLQACLDARRHLGLEPLPPPTVREPVGSDSAP